MNITESQKNEVRDLIAHGKKLEAVQYVQENFGLTLKQASELIKQVTKEMEEDGLDPNAAFQQKMKARVGLSKKSTKSTKITGSVFIVVGLIMLGVVTNIYISDSSFIEHAVLIEGKCTGYDSHVSSSDDGNTTMYTAIFEYEYEGQEYTHSSESSSSSQSYDYDEVIEIYINPSNPNEALVNSFWERWFVIILLGFMGSMFAGMGIMAIKVFGKKKISK